MLSAIILFVALAESAAILPPNKHVSDFRLFGEEGCFKLNLGVYTVISQDFENNGCNSLGSETVKSLLNTDIIKGCRREPPLIRPTRWKLTFGHSSRLFRRRMPSRPSVRP